MRQVQLGGGGVPPGSLHPAKMSDAAISRSELSTVITQRLDPTGMCSMVHERRVASRAIGGNLSPSRPRRTFTASPVCSRIETVLNCLADECLRGPFDRFFIEVLASDGVALHRGSVVEHPAPGVFLDSRAHGAHLRA